MGPFCPWSWGEKRKLSVIPFYMNYEKLWIPPSLLRKQDKLHALHPQVESIYKI